MLGHDFDCAIAAVEDWIVKGLPYWNNNLLDRTASVHAFADELRDHLKPILEIGLLDLARANRDRAREALAMLAFCACSIERATQAAGHDPGDGVKLVAGLADAMTALAVSAEMPPNLSAAGYWTANTRARWISFTGDPQERFFRDMVNAICVEHAIAIERLELLKHVRLTSARATGLLREAADTQKRVKRYYARFRNTVDRHNLDMTIDFFKNVMRTFLVAFPVNGVMWRSANAANVIEQALLDFMIGIVNDEYVKHIEERMRYMAPDERAALLDVMRSPSVLDRILEEMSLTPEDVLAMPVNVLAARLRASPEMRLTLQAFRDFTAAAAGASGAHFALIVEYLVKSENGSGGTCPVDPAHGTGGRTHAETKQVQEMRARHPVAHKICIATRLAWAASGAQAVEAA
jgi:Monodechloroaminopyrrolnitrin synthase PrnB